MSRNSDSIRNLGSSLANLAKDLGTMANNVTSEVDNLQKRLDDSEAACAKLRKERDGLRVLAGSAELARAETREEVKTEFIALLEKQRDSFRGDNQTKPPSFLFEQEIANYLDALIGDISNGTLPWK